MITLDDGPFGTFLIRGPDGRTRLIQHDSDFEGVACSFGWRGGGGNTSERIWNAYEYLERNIGRTVDDPGYF